MEKKGMQQVRGTSGDAGEVQLRISIFGPSTRFLSGITYFTIRLSNALVSIGRIDAILFRHMLPKKLFPGWKRVGKTLTSECFDPRVKVHEMLDWFNPVSWMNACARARNTEVLILPWWTSSVAHMYLFVQVFIRKRRFVGDRVPRTG